MKRHPAKHELLAYAENLVDNRAAISAKMAAHIASCPECLAEVQAMRASLKIVQAVPELEPSPEFTAELLIAARNERIAQSRRRGRVPVGRYLAKGIGYAACLAVISAVCFSAALKTGVPVNGLQASAVQRASGPDLSSDAIRKTTDEIQALASAVNVPSKRPPSLSELEHRRAASALNADLEAARNALERNPGCVRAMHTVDTSLQRQVEALRAVYVERSL